MTGVPAAHILLNPLEQAPRGSSHWYQRDSRAVRSPPKRHTKQATRSTDGSTHASPSPDAVVIHDLRPAQVFEDGGSSSFQCADRRCRWRLQ